MYTQLFHITYLKSEKSSNSPHFTEKASYQTFQKFQGCPQCRDDRRKDDVYGNVEELQSGKTNETSLGLFEDIFNYH